MGLIRARNRTISPLSFADGGDAYGCDFSGICLQGYRKAVPEFSQVCPGVLMFLSNVPVPERIDRFRALVDDGH
jgi:hypothetical protein